MNRHERFRTMHQAFGGAQMFRNDVGNGCSERLGLRGAVDVRPVEFPDLSGFYGCNPLRGQVFVTAQRIHVFQDRLVDVLAGDARIRMIYRSRPADAGQCFLYRFRVECEIGLREIGLQRIARGPVAGAVVPFPGFRRRLHIMVPI